MNKDEKKKIEKEFKPRTWLLIVLIIIGLGITVVLVDKVIEDKKKKDVEVKEKANDFVNNIFGNIKKQYEESQKRESDWDKKTFNDDYEFWSGTQSRMVIINIIDDVITNNKTNNEHIITVINGEINSTDPEEIRKIKDNIKEYPVEYEVILDYDENGYVNKITIEE